MLMKKPFSGALQSKTSIKQLRYFQYYDDDYSVSLRSSISKSRCRQTKPCMEEKIGLALPQASLTWRRYCARIIRSFLVAIERTNVGPLDGGLFSSSKAYSGISLRTEYSMNSWLAHTKFQKAIIYSGSDLRVVVMFVYRVEHSKSTP